MSSEKESTIKKKSNPIWIVFIITLLIVNLIGGSWVFWAYYSAFLDSNSASELGFLGVYPYLFTLVIIDIIAVFSYIRKQHPQGMAKVISYTALILIGVVLFL